VIVQPAFVDAYGFDGCLDRVCQARREPFIYAEKIDIRR